MLTDSLADMLTRIRNAKMGSHRHVDLPGSQLKRRVAEILVEEGYLESVHWTDDDKQGRLHLTLKYDENGVPVIEGLERISKPGRRYYAKVDDIPRVRSGLGISILSTSKGIMTGRDARQNNLGGEVLCTVW